MILKIWCLMKKLGTQLMRNQLLVNMKHLTPLMFNDAWSLDEELSSEEDLDEWLKGELKKHMNASDNVMPRSISEYLMLDNLEGASMSEEMDELTQQETLGTIKNVSIKIDKFEFPCDFVVTDMPENLIEIIILGRPFLETIHA
nr:hypothetical protein [Tanacetum cinerariifolium]